MAEAEPGGDYGEIADSPFRHLGVDLLVALVVLLLVFAADRIGLIPTDWAADRLLRYYAKTELRESRAERFLYIDIDAETFARIGEPLITPRDALVELLAFATTTRSEAEGRAKVVILDVALSQPADQADIWVRTPSGQAFAGTCAAGPRLAPELSARDRALYDFFADYDRPTPIILARGFSLGAQDPKNAGHARPEPSFLDGLDRIAPLDWFSQPDCLPAYDDSRIFWAAPFFERDADLLVRRWRLWSSWCREDAAGVLPSVQLLALALAARTTEGDVPLNALRQRFQEFGDISCGLAFAGATTSDVLPIGDREIALGKNEDGRRIIYTAPAERPFEAGPALTRQSAPSSPADLVVTLPAHLLLDPQAAALQPGQALVDPAILDDRIVVIGASHPQARDDYATPIGGMPGAMLILNATQSLAEFGVLTPVPPGVQLIYAIVVMSAVVCLFYVFNFRLAAWVSGLGVLAVTLLASSYALRQGLWLNTAIPATGLAWFTQLLAPMAALRAFRTEGWRALLNARFHGRRKAAT